MPILSAPQNIFLNVLPTKFRAYVGGLGCVHPDTKIHTEFGLMRISDIDRPMRVLSWNEKSQQFQFSLSGGSFPKGRENLYRVSTKRGEFRTSGHHRMLCVDGNYLQVKHLSAGDEVLSFVENLHDSSSELDQLSLLLNVQHYSEKDVSLMGYYANEARQYGQQFLSKEDSAQALLPLRGGVQKFFLTSLMCDQQGTEQLHNHHYQSTFHLSNSCFHLLVEHQESCEVNQTFSLSFEHISYYHQQFQQSVMILEYHHKEQQYSSVYHSYYNSSIESTTIISIEIDSVESPYYDMQVLDTNNYVTEDGCIHHNSGKTFVGCLDILNFFGAHPGTKQGYFGPSYPTIRDIFYPTFEEAAELLGFTIVIREGNKEIHVYRNGFYYGTVICRSMDNPGSIIGFKISRALVDEIDTLKKEKADLAWIKIIARLRLKIDGVVNGIGVTTTPEGFLFVYDKFKKEPTESYSMVQASSYENEEYLPPDYISSLYETYTEQLAKAYIDGEFVNLTSGTVYHSFDRDLNRSNETIQPNEHLYVGMDFNVGKMSAVTHVKRGDNAHAVDEIMGGLDTPHMIFLIKDKYWPKGKDRNIYVYPDASGDSRKSVDASTTDIDLLQQAGFYVIVDNSNPRVKNRVNAVNSMFKNAKGERRYFINPNTCRLTTEAFEQQAYNKHGEPDKSKDKDHPVDAAGYFIVHDYPIIKPCLPPRIRHF